jgi:hypothetical protein
MSSLLGVDTVCINQDDLTERNHQVQMMGSIYGSAKLVISWLGAEADNSANALHPIGRLAKAMPDKKDWHDLEWLKDFPEIWECQEDVELEQYPVFRAIRELDKRSLWHRGWTFQEAFLAKCHFFMFGNEGIMKNDLFNVGYFFQKVSPQHKMRAFMKNERIWRSLTVGRWTWPVFIVPNLRQLCKNWDPRHRIFQFAIYTISRKAKDPKDKIYSLFGLSENKFTVDYSLSTGSVYCKFSDIWVREREDLMFMSLAGSSIPSYVKRTDDNIPSWVPYWHAISQSGSFRVRTSTLNYTEGKFYKAQASIDSGILRTKVAVLDLGDVPTRVSLQNPSDWLPFCSSFCASEKNPPYPTGIPRLQAAFFSVVPLFNGW